MDLLFDNQNVYLITLIYKFQEHFMFDFLTIQPTLQHQR